MNDDYNNLERTVGSYDCKFMFAIVLHLYDVGGIRLQVVHFSIKLVWFTTLRDVSLLECNVNVSLPHSIATIARIYLDHHE